MQDWEHNVDTRSCNVSWFTAIAQHEAAASARDQGYLGRLVGDCERRSASSRAIACIANKPAAIFLAMPMREMS